MILGIGTDMVNISDIRAFLSDEKIAQSYLKHTFTEGERQEAEARSDRGEYFAARFAAKEAVFKAVAHLLAEKTFDLRIVETLNAPDGCPYVHVTSALQPILDSAGVRALHISITTEDPYAFAFVIAEG